MQWASHSPADDLVTLFTLFIWSDAIFKGKMVAEAQLV
jgi:hypothetical protein